MKELDNCNRDTLLFGKIQKNSLMNQIGATVRVGLAEAKLEPLTRKALSPSCPH
jgi:hypothetical protein